METFDNVVIGTCVVAVVFAFFTIKDIIREERSGKYSKK